MENKYSESFSRRDLLKKIGKAAGIGSVATIIEFPASVGLHASVERYTDAQSGNARIRESIKKKHAKAEDPETTYNNYTFSNREKVEVIAVSPPLEEFIFRGLPSAFCGHTADDGGKHLITGTGGFSLSRREFIYGTVTSLAFGAVHNLTDNGFDTDTIPAPQLLGGMWYWYLQRKFGIAANIAAHTSNNAAVVTVVEINSRSENNHKKSMENQ